MAIHVLYPIMVMCAVIAVWSRSSVGTVPSCILTEQMFPEILLLTQCASA